MPAYSSNPGMMSDDMMYSDVPEGSPREEASESPEEEKNEGQPVATLPKSILAGKDFKVGEELVLKIMAIHDDEVSVAYAPEKAEGKEEGPAESKPASMPPDAEMDGMMS